MVLMEVEKQVVCYPHQKRGKLADLYQVLSLKHLHFELLPQNQDLGNS